MHRAVRFTALIAGWTLLVGRAEAQQSDARSDWEVRPGFALDIDAAGFTFPSAIAFVPHPGPDPKDPLYFVTELAGRIMVVTNDRTIHTFAELGTTKRPEGNAELPDDGGEHGVAGICLDPAHGYVFATFVYDDAGGARRNNMVRLQSRPNTFSLQSEGEQYFTDMFKDHPSANSHQIGPCQVQGETVFVSVGDGLTGIRSQETATVVGKILRMTLDGKPVRDNPMYIDDDVLKPANYIWAMGLRNPFGLRLVGNRLFAADNGNNVDRFLEITKGMNYLWDGSDESISTNALVVFAPSVCPVATDYLEPGREVYPEEWQGLFFQTLGGKLATMGPGLGGERSIVTLDYDMTSRRMRRPPEPFVRFRGSGAQSPVAMAFGPDGLYFASILPTESGTSPIFKVRYDPEHEHRFVIGESVDPAVIIGAKYCRGCHRIGPRGGEAGPSLNQPELEQRLAARLNSPEYARKIAGVDSLTAEIFTSRADARREVMAATGRDRIRVWLKNRILEPRFDSPESAMPNLGLNETQAAAIADYLLGEESSPQPASFRAKLRSVVPPSRHRYTVLALVAGLVMGLVLASLLRRRTA